MNVTVLATCIKCGGAQALKEAAVAQGYEVAMETVAKSDWRSDRTFELGYGFPVLVRDDGFLSDDGVHWR